MPSLDWGLLATFVAVAREGSLTGAARALGISQPTASRHIQQLEAQLGGSLFVRHARGLTPSERGAELLGVAEKLDDDVQQLLRRASGLRESPAGSVRVTVNEPLGVYALMPAYASLTAAHPALELELVIDNGVQNLSRREADIAVRMFRPAQLDLIAKRIGDVEVGLYASECYLAKHGAPQSLGDMGTHVVAGLDRDPSWPRTLQQLGMQASDFRIRTDSILAHIQAVLDGVAMGGLHVPFAARHPGLVRLLDGQSLGSLEVWLVMHEDARKSAAVRAVFDALEAALRDYLALDRPGP